MGLRLYYAEEFGNRDTATAYFFALFDSDLKEFPPYYVESLKEELVMLSLGHPATTKFFGDVTLGCLTEAAARNYLLTSPTLRVLRSSSSSNLADVVDAWEKDGKITVPNPFRLEGSE